MTHRGYRDSLIAWRHINETLEAEISASPMRCTTSPGQLLVSVHLRAGTARARQCRRRARTLTAASSCSSASSASCASCRMSCGRPCSTTWVGWRRSSSWRRRYRADADPDRGALRSHAAPARGGGDRALPDRAGGAHQRHASCGRELRARRDRAAARLAAGVIADDGVGFEVEAAVRSAAWASRGCASAWRRSAARCDRVRARERRRDPRSAAAGVLSPCRCA